MEGYIAMPRADAHADEPGPERHSEARAAQSGAAGLLAAVVEDAANEVGAGRSTMSAASGSVPRSNSVDEVIGYLRDETLFAVSAQGRLEVRLPADIADAALRTPDTTASPRGGGWIAFVPRTAERHVADRARAWFVTAWRNAGPGNSWMTG